MTQSQYTLSLTSCITYNDFSNYSLWKLPPIPYKLGRLPYYWPQWKTSHLTISHWTIFLQPHFSSLGLLFSSLTPELHRCGCVCLHKHVKASGHSPPYFLKLGLSLALALTGWTGWPASPRDCILLPPHASTGISGTCYHVHLLWASGIQIQVLMGFYELSHLPGPSSVLLWDAA